MARRVVDEKEMVVWKLVISTAAPVVPR